MAKQQEGQFFFKNLALESPEMAQAKEKEAQRIYEQKLKSEKMAEMEKLLFPECYQTLNSRNRS